MIEICNKRTSRWEVYDAGKGVVRNGEIQPVFVCDTQREAEDYIKRVEKAKK